MSPGAPRLEVQFLPAREGDAIWLRWTGDDGAPHQAIIDMGKEETGRALVERFRALPEDQRVFDLLVVTHMDGDHIGGVLTCVSDANEPVPGLVFRDVWFNGWPHLHGERAPDPLGAGLNAEPLEAGPEAEPLGPAAEPLGAGPEAEPLGPAAEPLGPAAEPLGPVQGERLTRWLMAQSWNAAFGRGPVVRPDDAVAAPVDLPGGVRLTVLGPTQDRLTALIGSWRRDVEKALAKGTLDWASPGLDLSDLPVPGAQPLGADAEDVDEFEPGFEPLGPATPPVLETPADLEELAATPVSLDSSGANGASIVLLLEWHGRRLLLTGDAFADDVLAGLVALRAAETGEALSGSGADEGAPDAGAGGEAAGGDAAGGEAAGGEAAGGDVGRPLAFDVVKLPHHGSARNLTRELVEAAEAPVWVFSTDGTKFRHPDAIAIARLLVHGRQRDPLLAFNVPSQFNGWWDNDAWRTLVPYHLRYGDPAEGLTLSFEPGEG